MGRRSGGNRKCKESAREGRESNAREAQGNIASARVGKPRSELPRAVGRRRQLTAMDRPREPAVHESVPLFLCGAGTAAERLGPGSRDTQRVSGRGAAASARVLQRTWREWQNAGDRCHVFQLLLCWVTGDVWGARAQDVRRDAPQAVQGSDEAAKRSEGGCVLRPCIDGEAGRDGEERRRDGVGRKTNAVRPSSLIPRGRLLPACHIWVLTCAT